jgi:hypothetical protein
MVVGEGTAAAAVGLAERAAQVHAGLGSIGYASFSRLTGQGDALTLTAVLDRLWRDADCRAL